jgi:antitoxin component YwqK of YwqJK toxin-antitoxin module
MRGLIVCLFLLISGNILAQNTINQIDAQGRKQGSWTKKDAEGKLIYQATFKDDKPVGEMKRFHLNGVVKAIINFEEGSDISDAQLFDERGKIIAKGKYAGQKKTGAWNYLKDNKIVATETYQDGKKNGISKRFYQTGELLEESNWRNDRLNGIYRTYFQNGKPYLECNYSEGLRNGVFVIWFPNEVQELNGFYANNIQDKEWNYFDENGKLLYTLEYSGGELLNPEVKDSLDGVNAGIFKNKGDSIPDPEKFMQNPEEYMELMKNR